MPRQKVFTIRAKVDSARDFETFAAFAARLRKHGKVEMALGSVSGPSRRDIPKGGSSWHDYTSYLATLVRFFPHPKIAPFVDRAYVRRNLRLLRSCARVMRKYKLNATFDSHEPFYLAEGFFEKYPHLRGARVDHPRRSRQEAYAMCVDQPEAQDIIAGMVKSLVKEVPELTSFTIHTNDAGAGLCWGDQIYSGPNGPDHCRGRNAGERVASIVEALNRGASKTLEINFHANISRAEAEQIPHYVDEHFHFWGGRDPRTIGVGMYADNPVQGIFNPVAILDALARTRDSKVDRINLSFSNNYSRSHNDPRAAEKVIEFVDAFLDKPAWSLLDRMKFLHAMCDRWVGRDQADALFEALVSLDKVLSHKEVLGQMFVERLSGNYLGVSMRLINRPLVAIPEKLTPREEAYFLPHVFNVREQEARADYLDLHGSHVAPPIDVTQDYVGLPQMTQLCAAMNRCASALEGLKGPRAEVFRRMGVSLRIYSCIMRSIGNFSIMQVLRDRNRDKLHAPQPLVPSKAESWTGDPDLLLINETMRDELDNTDTLIDILERGGLSQLALAPSADLEDTFFLGPNFLDTLKQKRRIMRRHWLDAERYMASPLK